MIKDRYLNINVYTDKILLLLAEWDTDDFMYVPSIFHIRLSYVTKYKSHDLDTPEYIDGLSGKHVDEYYKLMCD